MTDQQLALHAIGEAQLILQPRPQNDERTPDKLLVVLDRPYLVVGVSRLQQRSNLWMGK